MDFKPDEDALVKLADSWDDAIETGRRFFHQVDRGGVVADRIIVMKPEAPGFVLVAVGTDEAAERVRHAHEDEVICLWTGASFPETG